MLLKSIFIGKSLSILLTESHGFNYMRLHYIAGQQNLLNTYVFYVWNRQNIYWVIADITQKYKHMAETYHK